MERLHVKICSIEIARKFLEDKSKVEIVRLEESRDHCVTVERALARRMMKLFYESRFKRIHQLVTNPESV